MGRIKTQSIILTEEQWNIRKIGDIPGVLLDGIKVTETTTTKSQDHSSPDGTITQQSVHLKSIF